MRDLMFGRLSAVLGRICGFAGGSVGRILLGGGGKDGGGVGGVGRLGDAKEGGVTNRAFFGV